MKFITSHGPPKEPTANLFDVVKSGDRFIQLALKVPFSRVVLVHDNNQTVLFENNNEVVTTWYDYLNPRTWFSSHWFYVYDLCGFEIVRTGNSDYQLFVTTEHETLVCDLLFTSGSNIAIGQSLNSDSEFKQTVSTTVKCNSANLI